MPSHSEHLKTKNKNQTGLSFLCEGDTTDLSVPNVEVKCLCLFIFVDLSKSELHPNFYYFDFICMSGTPCECKNEAHLIFKLKICRPHGSCSFREEMCGVCSHLKKQRLSVKENFMLPTSQNRH